MLLYYNFTLFKHDFTPDVTVYMKNQIYFYILLVALIIVDAWLLAHPNIIGKMGIWIYKYTYLKTFPRALLTVSLVAIATLGVGEVVKRFLPKTTATFILGILLAISVYLLVQTIVQFSSGSYSHTGSGFKTGAIVLPLIPVLLLAKYFQETFGVKAPTHPNDTFTDSPPSQ